MMSFSTVFRLAAILALPVAGLRAADYHVAADGDDTNSGLTAAKPWKSLAKVSATTFAPGDRILIRAGDVREGFLAPSGSGTREHPIVITRYGEGPDPVLHGKGTSGETPTATIHLAGVSHWEISRLEITNDGPSVADRSGIRADNPDKTKKIRCAGITVRDCHVHDVNSNPKGGKMNGGIIFEGVFDDITVDSCHVHDVTKEGIRNKCPSVSCTNIRFTRNRIENVFGDGMVISGITKGGYAAFNRLKNTCISKGANYAGLWLDHSRGSVVEYNEVSGITGGFGNDGEAFDDDLGCDGDIFQYNYSHDNAGGFILVMPYASNLTVRYNISRNDGGGRGQELIQYAGNTAKNNVIHNNTFYVGPHILTRLFKKNSRKVVSFHNNIVYCDGTIDASSGGFGDGSSFRNNAFFPAEKFVKDGAYFFAQTAPVTGDPGLLAPQTGGDGFESLGGFRLRPGSPCLTGGFRIAKNGGRDFAGDAVSDTTAPGIGALAVPGGSAAAPLKITYPKAP